MGWRKKTSPAKKLLQETMSYRDDGFAAHTLDVLLEKHARIIHQI